ncbi:hypothetical protein [Massilia genomosp. 1]|uniref:hypothetical protein n=1 Tax=Massilia genomosp. 1 TaxID=2609280 RepID=UPI001E4AF3D6|nr:hypothetical protein [Massilia genomosp. 1]
MSGRGAVIRLAALAGWLRRQAALLAVLAVLGTDTLAAGAPALAAPRDLAADAALAAQRGQPLLLLFSLPGCAYCDVVRRNYLLPLTREGAARGRPDRHNALHRTEPGSEQRRRAGRPLPGAHRADRAVAGRRRRTAGPGAGRGRRGRHVRRLPRPGAGAGAAQDRRPIVIF